MKRIAFFIFVLAALAQLSVPASMVWIRHQTLKNGRVWKFKTAPVDPEDAFRGRYVALRFAAEEFPQTLNEPWNNPVYAVLKEDGDGFAAVDHLTNDRIKSDDVVPAEPMGWYDGKQRVRFPFQQYWVTEQAAPEAEAAYMNNSTRKNQNAYVTVRVRNGDAALEELYINNQPLAEYLRSLHQAEKH